MIAEGILTKRLVELDLDVCWQNGGYELFEVLCC
jgi:hypothetical protein